MEYQNRSKPFYEKVLQNAKNWKSLISTFFERFSSLFLGLVFKLGHTSMNILLNINIGEKLLWVPTNIVVGPYKILNFLERIILPLNLNFSQLALPPLSFLLVVLLFPSLPLKYSKNIIFLNHC